MSRPKNSLRIEIDAGMGERIRRLGGSLGPIMRYSASEIADDLAFFIRETFLTGRALEKRTKETYGSVKGYEASRGPEGHYVDFGVGVNGHLNYLHRWNGTSREFMRPARAAYEATGRWVDLVEENLERMGRKLEVL